MSHGFSSDQGLASDVDQGGTGVTAAVPYAVVTGGGAPTDPLQFVAPGAAGAALVSGGPSAPPIFGPVLGSLAEQDADSVAITGGSAVLTSVFRPPVFTVADLPAGGNGNVAYASNGRKVGEAAGFGTGVPVYFSGSAWRVFSTDLVVSA